MIRYNHSQTAGWPIWVTALAAIVALIVVYIIQPVWVLWLTALVLAVMLVLFWKMRVVVDDEYVHAIYGIGLFHFKWPMADLVAAEQVRNRAWWGWGIRWTPYGWLYNIAGLDAVQITRKNRKPFRIGTDEPQNLLDALKTVIGK